MRASLIAARNGKRPSARTATKSANCNQPERRTAASHRDKRAGRMRKHSPGPDHQNPSRPHKQKRDIPMTKRTNSTRKPKNEATELRDALPFFKKGRGKVATSWWNVTPAGNYSADLETGKAYARAFMPMLRFNAGASDLAAIVSDMAKSGRHPANNPKDWRGIDAVALGFMMEVGGSLQASIVGMAVAACAIE